MSDAVSQSFVFARSTTGHLPTIKNGQGALLWDTEGRRYIDGSAGAIVVNIGHGRSEMAEALAEQARAVAYVHATHFTSSALETYAARLVRHVPGQCNRLYLVSGGSEANETAIKLARAYHLATGSPGRHKVIRGSVSYHGNTLGTLAHSGRPTLQAPYLPLLSHTASAPAPFCAHCALDQRYPDCDVACANELERLIEREDPETVAAYIAEPVIGASAGAAVPPDEYLRRARAICSRFGVLYIDDEIMTGFGRTGRWFAIEWSGVAPDIVTCGKGMSGGYMPVGAVLATGDIVDAVNRAGGFAHGFTFSHNPVTAAACLKALDILERENLIERSEQSGQRLLELLRPLTSHSHVGDIRGRGLMIGIELVRDKHSMRAFARTEKRAEALAAEAFERGLVLYPSGGCADGYNGDIVMVAPPFVISETELEEMAAILDGALTAAGL